jgi:hypothetical protein
MKSKNEETGNKMESYQLIIRKCKKKSCLKSKKWNRYSILRLGWRDIGPINTDHHESKNDGKIKFQRKRNLNISDYKLIITKGKESIKILPDKFNLIVIVSFSQTKYFMLQKRDRKISKFIYIVKISVNCLFQWFILSHNLKSSLKRLNQDFNLSPVSGFYNQWSLKDLLCILLRILSISTWNAKTERRNSQINWINFKILRKRFIWSQVNPIQSESTAGVLYDLHKFHYHHHKSAICPKSKIEIDKKTVAREKTVVTQNIE